MGNRQFQLYAVYKMHACICIHQVKYLCLPLWWCVCVKIIKSAILPAPCPPTQLMVSSSCESNNITVSWLASQGSVSYIAVAEDAQGHRWLCNSSSTACQIAALPCGQEYQVYVAGFDENCVGAKSAMKVTRTGTCTKVMYVEAEHSLLKQLKYILSFF